MKYLTLMSILSWRIHWLTFLSRTGPDEPASAILSDIEIEVLKNKFYTGKQPQLSTISVYQVSRWIAQLGGFLNRKSDGDPGSDAIWRGWKRLNNMNQGWELRNSKKTYG